MKRDVPTETIKRAIRIKKEKKLQDYDPKCLTIVAVGR